jgi:uncharacterized membrane protein YesL
MKEIFRLDSRWVQRFAMLTNLVCLNVLWLICCVPVFTIGAATAALYHTVFLYHNKEDDAVLKPFFRAFKENFRQSTILLLPLLMVLALLVFDVLYLTSIGTGMAVLFVLIVLIVFTLGIMVHLFPLIARFQMNVKALLRTAFSLVVLHLPATLLVIALTFLPVFLLFFQPAFFLRVGVAWVGVWFSAIAYFFGKFLLKIWNKHAPTEAENNELHC